MRKLLSVAIVTGALLSQTIHAKPQICPFTDRMAVIPAYEFVIDELTHDSNINAEQIELTLFDISCKNIFSSGSVYLTVGHPLHGGEQCKLEIIDGPFVDNPYVEKVSCSGSMKYLGMISDKSHYFYQLKFGT